jgi:BirA family biotin operon repressor/biotin-[acetyl-CoA-carboxylase] ligase
VSIRTKLIHRFDGPAGRLISGEALARDLGVSRTAVWKQVKALKEAGLPIEGTGRQGYRLKAPVDNTLIQCHPDAWTIPHYFLNTPSTQTLAKAGGAAGLPEGHLWIAETQAKGRGRLDRAWESTYGGLWFSLLMRPGLPASKVPPITLLAGLSLSNTVQKICGINAQLKWPNDVVIGKRKIAGILTEMSGQLDRTEWVVIGVGLNVHNTLSQGLEARAATLYGLTGKVWPRAHLLKAFLDSFRGAYDRYQKEGFEPFRRTYWSRYFAPDRKVQLKTAGGLVTGIAHGVDVSGAIMIESRRKISLISEGEIIL